METTDTHRSNPLEARLLNVDLVTFMHIYSDWRSGKCPCSRPYHVEAHTNASSW